MSTFWSGWIIVLSVLNLIGCIWLIRWTMKKRNNESATGDVTGHVWDGDLEEYNNPLPRWWLWLFYLTLVFAAIYLALYPGLGNFGGSYGWSQTAQYEEEMAQANAKYNPIYEQYAAVSVADLATDAQYQEARDMGKRLFLTYCMQCHGSDAAGFKGYPDLTDKDWLWGGSPEQIKTSIAVGRQAVMPPHAHLTDEVVGQLTQYLLSHAGQASDTAAAEAGKSLFLSNGCVGCHGMDGTGNAAMGAPNLTDAIWLYGSSPKAIAASIKSGRMGQMPGHQDLLDSNKIHLLTAYVYSLSK
jgi:cytochrome c oxidase cbb3-type subunit 3